MTSNDTYQGWTNRETWCVALWLNNEQGLHEGARSACNTDGEMLQEAAQSLEDYVNEVIEEDTDVGGKMILDLVNCALARCDFRAIAETFREDAK